MSSFIQRVDKNMILGNESFATNTTLGGPFSEAKIEIDIISSRLIALNLRSCLKPKTLTQRKALGASTKYNMHLTHLYLIGI